MELIGYTCSYIPVEILSAAGYRPYRLLHGDFGLMEKSDPWLRVDACPLVRSNLGFLLEHQQRFVAVVGSTGCDMSRRMLEIVDAITDIPTIIINMPRTDRLEIYYDEIDYLIKRLAELSGGRIDDEQINRQIRVWEGLRNFYRHYSEKRRENPSRLSTVSFHHLVANFHQGNTQPVSYSQLEVSNLPRVFLLGSPVGYESTFLLKIIEKYLRIIWDYNCGLSRFLNVKIKGKGVDGIKSAYYQQPPCILRRPNKKFYEFIKKKIVEYKPTGMVLSTLDYCDAYEFELIKIGNIFGLPTLNLRSDFSFQNRSQLETRINAFQEMINT